MSLVGKKLKNAFRDFLHTDNLNAGVSTSSKTIKTGNGDSTALSLSTNQVYAKPGADTTAAFQATDKDGNALLTVDSDNDLVKAGIGQYNVSVQYKSFGLWDFSPSAGEHHNLTTTPMITSASDGDFTGEVNGAAWGRTGADPVLELTVASAALELVPALWILRENITIEAVQFVMASDAASTINLHVVAYDCVAGSGASAGDLSGGAVIADHVGAITTGSDRVSNGTITIQTADVNSGKAIMVFAEASDTDDMTVQVNIKYHCR